MCNLADSMITKKDEEDVKRWKLHYGLRTVGKTVDGHLVVSGLDSFKLTSSVGIDLDFFLMKLHSENLVVDWVGYCKAATIEGWLVGSILSKIKYPIIENYGERYWAAVESRIKIWFINYMG